MKGQYKVKAKVWLYPGDTPWHFVTIPKATSTDIKKAFAAKTRGFGSLRVAATIGKTTWATSIFPDSRSGSYMLPVKAEIRKKEGVAKGDTVALVISIK